MSDVFSQYQAGLQRLLIRLEQDHPTYTEVLVYQQRLLENLARTRLYGDTDAGRAERAEILDRLNRLALEAVGQSFNVIVGTALSKSGAAAHGKGDIDAKTGVAEGDDKEGGVTGIQRVDTEGGALIFGDVAVSGGDFVGGDKIVINDDDSVGGYRSGITLVEHYQQELEKARKAGDRAAEGMALDKLGSACAARGDFHRAVTHYDQAVAAARAMGDRQAEAIYLQNLGLAILRLADAEPDQRQAHLSRATDTLLRAIGLFDAAGAASLLRARTRYHLGRCYHQLGQWREATALLEQARESFSYHKARPELAHALLELGQLYHQRQDLESARIYLKDALRLFRRLNDADGIAVAQEALGNFALQTNRPTEAIVSLREARQGYATLQRSERVRAVDDLLRIAHQARRPAGGTTS